MPGWVNLLPRIAKGLHTLPEHMDEQSSSQLSPSLSSSSMMAMQRQLEQQQAVLDVHQALLAVPFVGLGAWCLVWPHSVERLCLQKKYRHESKTSALLMSCFGSQAVLFGLAMLTVEPTREFYASFATVLTPYLVFNYWGLYGEGRKMFTKFLWLDAVGNCLMLAVVTSGYFRMR